MKLLKRIGTQNIKFDFEIHIQKIEMTLKQKQDLFLQWQRGTIKAQTSEIQNLSNIDQTLQMTATLYFEPKAKVFLSKQTKVN